jgi:hypothetical protein
VTQTEQLMTQLRAAIRAEIADEIRAYRDTFNPDEQSDGYLDGMDDAILTIEQG